MSRTAKWIIGILLGLIALAAIVLAGLWLFNWWGGGLGMSVSRRFLPFDGREMPFRGMRPYQGIVPFGGARIIGLLAGGLICLGFVALLVIGVIALVRGVSRQSRSAVAPVSTPPPAPAATQPCPNCGRPVQEDWSHCPYCGEDLTAPEDSTPET